MKMTRIESFQRFILSSQYNKSIYYKYVIKKKKGITEITEEKIKKELQKQYDQAKKVYDKNAKFFDENFYENLRKNLHNIATITTTRVKDISSFLSGTNKTRIEKILQDSFNAGTFTTTSIQQLGISKKNAAKAANDLHDIAKTIYNVFEAMRNIQPQNEVILGGNFKVINEGSTQAGILAYKNMIGAGATSSYNINHLKGVLYESLYAQAVIGTLQTLKQVSIVGGKGKREDISVSAQIDGIERIFNLSIKSSNPFEERNDILINFGNIPEIIQSYKINNTLNNKYQQYIILSSLYYMSTNLNDPSYNYQEQLLNQIKVLSELLAYENASRFIGLISSIKNNKPILFIGLGSNLVKGYEFLKAIKEGLFEVYVGSYNYQNLNNKKKYLPSNMSNKITNIEKLQEGLKEIKSGNLYITNYIMQREKTVQFIAQKTKEKLTLSADGVIQKK